MKFYDLNLKGNSYESDKELILEANRLGWDYLNLLYPPDTYVEALKYKKELMDELNNIVNNNSVNNNVANINSANNNISNSSFHPIEIEFGVEINPKNQNEMEKISRKIRNTTKFIAVLGGDSGINRAVCESQHIDVLSRPYLKQKSSCGINQVLAKEAFRNDVAIELLFNDILSSYLSYRAKIMAHFREIIKLHQKFKFPLIISTGSSSIWDIRSPRDISSVFLSLGLSEEEVNSCLHHYPKNIVEFNKERENRVVLGVKKIDR